MKKMNTRTTTPTYLCSKVNIQAQMTTVIVAVQNHPSRFMDSVLNAHCAQSAVIVLKNHQKLNEKLKVKTMVRGTSEYRNQRF